MAAGKSSKDFAKMFTSNRNTSSDVATENEPIVEAVSETKTQKPKSKNSETIETGKMTAKTEPQDSIIEQTNPEPEKKDVKHETSNRQVKDGTTILSLVLTPEKKSFIRFEASRRGITMNEYINSLIQPDYEKDLEDFRKYEEFMRMMKH